MKQLNRPIATHLSSYKPQITSINSIFHRISGFILSFILFFISLIIIFISSFISFNLFYILFSLFNFITPLICYILMLTFSFHFLNGIRHVFWDFCLGLDLENITKTALLTIFTAFMLVFIAIIL